MSTRAASTSRIAAYRLAGVIVLLTAAVVSAVVSLIVGGGVAPLLIQDSGSFVRWSIPILKLVMNLAAAGMLGSLVLALFALRGGDKPFDTALDIASVSTAVFTVSAGLTGFLAFMSAFNPRLSAGPEFGAQLGRYLLQTALGQSWLITTIFGAVITVLAFAWRTWTPTLITALLAAASFVPLATQGHAGDLAGHAIAVNSILLHTIGAAVWLGGLMLVVALRGRSGIGVATLVRRYSSLAIAAFVVMTVSGIVRSFVALGDVDALWTPYGLILLAKTALLAGMGMLGAWYRMRLIPHLEGECPARWFWMLVLCEVALMGLASGAAAALARTPPPTGEEAPLARTPAEILTRSPLPPEFTLDCWITAWDIDVLWLVIAGLGLFFYLAGARRLRRRGERWPLYRTVFWVLGMLMLVWVTSGPINAYQEYLFSVHMLGHMMLLMAIPLLLVSGAPITLALRAIRKRDDSTRGGREWILWAVHSPFSRVVTHPFVAAVVFIFSLWAFYFTDLVRWSMYEYLGHQWMIIHLLIIGYLFVMSLVGIDPMPYSLPYPRRLLTLIAVMAMHAFFGVAIMMQEGLMVAEWFGSIGRDWGPTPMENQHSGGSIAWSIGDIHTLILAITVAIQWSRSDTKLQRRSDRHADRTGDVELEEYNAQVAVAAEHDRRREDRGRMMLQAH